MAGFAANSLLCRAAPCEGAIDAAAFTAIRLATGAVVLGVIVRRTTSLHAAGTWSGALVLSAYAAAFSYAYLRIGASAGALILFGAVQLTRSPAA